MKTHPKWKYAVGKSIIVHNEEEEAALDGEWFDLPEQLDAHLDEKARKLDEDRAAKRAAKVESDDLDKQINDLKKDLQEEDLPDIETLRTTAAEMGLEVHPRAGAKKISDMIKAAIEAKGE